MSDPNQQAAAGWYPDGQGSQRYWDGQQWTDAVVPGVPQPQSALSDEKTMALLAHVLTLFTGFIGPLIIYLVARDDQPFIKHHAAEALNFQITVVIGYVISFVLMFVVIGFVTFAAIWVAAIVFAIIAAIAANRGEWYRYPVNIRLVPGAQG